MASMWDHIRVFFKDSEVVLWGRIQVVAGIVIAAAAAMDWSPLLATGLSVRQIVTTGGVLVVQGVITELARRAREPHDLGVKTVADLSTVNMPIKKEDAVVVDPATGAVTITPPVPVAPAGVVSKAAGE